MAQHRSRFYQSLITVALAALLPAAAMAQQPQTHTVREGDTLWDLAGQYLGDPFLWPEIYRLNTDVVEDPHWIYPGEVLRLAGGADVSAVPEAAEPAQPEQPSEVVVVVEGAEEPAPAAPGIEEPEVAPAVYRPMTRRRVEADHPVVLNPLILEDPEPIKFAEYQSAGFLTERRKYPFGLMRGPVTPSEIGAGAPQVNLFDLVGITPPRGGSYQVGDSLLIVHFGREVDGYGNVILPTGIVRVVRVSPRQATAEIIAVYNAILPGQLSLPLPAFNSPGRVSPVPVADGISASVIANRNRVELTEPLHILFLDKGRSEGVKLGDVFEIRRVPAHRDPQADMIDEVMATVQIVNVNEHTSSAQVLDMALTGIRPGLRARQVARLPT